ncbi:T9SS type A sorting domain-containing protein [Galbibacter sp. BG1]|uniref:T9SS type A sorting domain-containing protein n=1 Tax=Galbibacter sp. BG1 TaxID=1170699 RepID=UPI0015BFEB46|nr:T9SS type A sorting domain-containing protein [Galbibacter sp. BG1]QLE00385.1 T9SS type A sorting domain-containing protein [Galbibacter sp. BG1]
MKRILLLIGVFVLLGLRGGYGQYKYRVQYEVTLKDPILKQSPPYSINSYTADVRLNGSRRIYFSSTISQEGDNYQKKDFIVDLPEKLTEINVTSTIFAPADDFPECVNDPDRYMVIPYNSNNVCYSNMVWFSSCLDVTYKYFKITPYEEPPASNNLSCLSEKINIPINSCVNYTHIWEYTINSSNPADYKDDLPQENLSKNLNISPADVPNAKVGDLIRFRMKFLNKEDGNLNIETESYSKPYIYEIIACSPKIIAFEETNSTCSNSTDGEVTFTFEDQLEEGYKMRFYVYDADQRSFFDDEARLVDPELKEKENLNGFPEVYVDDQVDNFDADNKTTLTGLTANIDGNSGIQEYFVVYQSIDDSSGNVVVKSGEISENFTIQAPTPVVITSGQVTHPKCAGETGSVTVSASGGDDFKTGGIYYFTYNGLGEWKEATSTNPASYTFTDLTPESTYTFEAKLVFADKECVSPSTVEESINAAPSELKFGPTAYKIFQQPTYKGAANGILDIYIQGGTSPYTYKLLKLDNSSVVPEVKSSATSITLQNVPEGNFKIRIEDSNGCFIEEILDEFIAPEGISIDKSKVTQMTCAGKNDGTITVEASDGFVNDSNDYTYTWTKDGDASFTASSSSITNLSAGDYTVTVADKNTDENEYTRVSETYIINEQTPISIENVSVKNITCKGAGDGQISVQVAGGNGDYAWKLSGTNGDFTKFPKGSSIVDIAITAYTYRATLIIASVTDWDNNVFSCEVTHDELITVDEPLLLEIEEVPNSRVDNNIYGGSTGSITVQASGGTEGYSYQWYDSEYIEIPGKTNATINNLPAGFYSVSTTDENLCTATLDSIEIVQPPKLEIESSTIDSVKCFNGADGAITITVKGGKDPYSYQWEKVDDTDFSTENSPTISNLSAGDYIVTVTDDSGSTASAEQTISVLQPEPLELTAVVQDNLCFSDNKGSIDITVTGGVGDYTFSWSNGGTSEDITGLTSGDYKVTVTDKNDCVLEKTINVGQPKNALAMTVDIEKQITGFGYNDGEIAVTITGGTPSYSYEWFSDNGFTSTEEDINNLAPGNYTLMVTDDSGGDCVIDKEFTIIEPDKLLVNLEETFSVLCKDGTDAELQANVIGGVKPYKFQWFGIVNGNKQAMASEESFLMELPAGDYQVEITDDNGVTTTSEVHTINEPERLVISGENIQHVLCHGEATGSIDISIVGGTPPYSIYWSNDATSEDIQNLVAGTYKVAVKDDNGCWAEATYEVENAFEPLSITNVDLTNVSKFRGSDGEIGVTIAGGEEPYTLQWTRLEDREDLGGSPTINNLVKGNYQLTVTDANGCSLTEQYEITQPDIVDETIVNPTCYEGCDGSLSVIVNKGNGNFTYSWSNGSTAATLTDLCAGSYTVSIEGFNNETLVRTYVVENPEPLVVDLGEDLTTLCNDQERTLDATIEDGNASYAWTSDNGFFSNSPVVTVDQAGLYTVTVTDSKGCQGTDTIEIKESPNDIAAEFFVSSQVFVNERFTVVDVTNPLPDSIEWILPEEGIVVSHDQDQAELYFEAPGEYEIIIKTRVGDCEAYQAKKVLVIDNHESVQDESDEEDREASFEEFLVYPNPTGGKFEVSLELKKPGNVSVRIFNLANNSIVAQKTGSGKNGYVLNFDISQYPEGMYAIVLETPKGNSVRKLIKG